MLNWLQIGYELARLVIYTSSGALLAGILYARYVQPDLMAALTESVTTTKNLAKLAGVKSQEYKDSKGIEKAVARDIIQEKIPELDIIKTFVSQATWDEIQDTIDNNPEAILQLWDKYGHLLQNTQEAQDSKFMF